MDNLIPFHVSFCAIIRHFLGQLFSRSVEESHENGLSLNDKTGSWKPDSIATMS
jgi:hypothetical protein